MFQTAIHEIIAILRKGRFISLKMSPFSNTVAHTHINTFQLRAEKVSHENLFK